MCHGIWGDSDERCAVLQTVIDCPQYTSSGACLVDGTHFPDQLMSHFPSVLLWPQLCTDVIGRYLSGLYFSSFQIPFHGILSASLYLAERVFGYLEMGSELAVEIKLSYSYCICQAFESRLDSQYGSLVKLHM